MKLRTAAGLGRAARAAARRRRRRRGQLRRPRARDPRPAVAGAPRRRTASRSSDLEQALDDGSRERQRRRAASAAPSSSSSAARACSPRSTTSRVDARSPPTTARRSACRTSPTVERGLGAAPGRRQPRHEQLDTVEGIVLMRRGENPSAVLERVRDAVDELNARLLPPTACRSTPSTTAPTWSTRRCTPSATTCSRAALLVTLVLFVFLLDLRAALIVARADPALAAVGVHLPQAARHERRTCSAWARSTSASSSTAAW